MPVYVCEVESEPIAAQSFDGLGAATLAFLKLFSKTIRVRPASPAESALWFDARSWSLGNKLNLGDNPVLYFIDVVEREEVAAAAQRLAAGFGLRLVK